MDRVIAFDQEMLISMALVLISSLVMIAIVAKLLYQPVLKFMRDRADGIKTQIETAEETVANANKLKAEYEQKLATFEKEKITIISDIHKQALDEKSKIINEAHAEAQNIKVRALNEIKIEEERIKDDIKTQMIDVSNYIAVKFISKTIDEDTQKSLIKEAIEDLGEVKWLK